MHETIITALDRQMLALVREDLNGYVAFSQLHFGLGDKLDFRWSPKSTQKTTHTDTQIDTGWELQMLYKVEHNPNYSRGVTCGACPPTRHNKSVAGNQEVTVSSDGQLSLWSWLAG